MFRAVTFELTGTERLACEGCEQRVERMLKAVPGVRQVKARASNQTVEVVYDAGALAPDAIQARLEKAGYQTTISPSASDTGR